MKARTIVIILIVVLVLAAGGLLFYQQTQRASAAAAVAPTATLSRGTLVATVTAAGNLYAPQQSNLNFQLTGVPIIKVNVQVGDKVKSGGVLAQVDDSDLQFALNTANANLTSAKARLELLNKPAADADIAAAKAQVASAQAGYESAVAKLTVLQQPAASADVAAAQAQLSSAQAGYESAVAKYNALQLPPASADVAAAQAQVASAQAAYNAALDKFNHAPDQITVAKAALDKATIALQQAQSAYNTVAWRSDIGMLPQSAALQQATIDYQSALSNYNLAATGINDSAVKAAAQGLAQAQANLAKLVQGPQSDAVTAANASIVQAQQSMAQAQANLAKLIQGPQADALAAANASIVQAQQSVAQAQANLAKLTTPPTAQDTAVSQSSVDTAQVAVDQAKRKLDQAKIVAPFDGTVAAVNYVVGQLSANTPPMIMLVNLNNLQTQINLSEVDITKIKMDQEVSLTFDALGQASFPGKIVSISPVGTTTQGVVNYVVTVSLTRPDAAIKPGMTAQANIIVDRRDNALLAPNRAIKSQGNLRIVSILFEGRPMPVAVRTGLSNDTSTEILSATATTGETVDLREGDTVLLNTTTTSAGARGGGGPAFIPGGGGGFGR